MNMLSFDKKQRSAFTIVELLVVIVVIGILATITIISYSGIQRKADVSIIKTQLSDDYHALELYHVEHGVYPTAVNSNGCSSAPIIDTRYCVKNIQNGSLAFTSGDNNYTVKIANASGQVKYELTSDQVIAPTSFAYSWGGPSGADLSYSITKTNDGGYATAGYTNSLGVGGAADAFIVKYNQNGAIVWNRAWGGSSNDGFRSIIQTPDNNYVATGYTNSYTAGASDVLIAKFDANGNLLWNKTWGGNNGTGNENIQSIVSNLSGGFTAAGYGSSFGSGLGDTMLIKYEADGTILNCASSMCKTPTDAIKTTPLPVLGYSATTVVPIVSGTISTPDVTPSIPNAIITTIVE